MSTLRRQTRSGRGDRTSERGLALMAVLFALTLLMLLALPFSVSMSVGAEQAARDVDQVATEQASASVRELLLTDVGLSHPAIDPDPEYDSLDEWPSGVELTDALQRLTESGRVLLGGEVEDLQRYLSLDSASPLLLANAIGTSARLTADLEEDASALMVDDTSMLPDSGFVWVGNEVIGYEQKDGGSLLGLTRGLLQAQGFRDGTEGIAEGSLVLDYRCVLAVTWPYLRAEPGRRAPWRAVGEMVEIEKAGFGTFTAEEVETFERLFTVDSQAETSATWGRPERIFAGLEAMMSRTLIVRSAAHIGAGSTVRLRDLQTGRVEYVLVMRTGSQRAAQARLLLPSVYELQLLEPVKNSFNPIDTVVEPLVPAPINVNTASEEVLTAVFAHVRQSDDLQVPEDNQRQRRNPPNLNPREAQDLAAEIVMQRGDGGGPFTGWQDLVDRVFRPRLEGDGSEQSRDARANKWLDLYRCMRTGRHSRLEMGTAPIAFASGPWVRYRAAATRSRSVAAPGVVGRHERSGLAAVMPGFGFTRRWQTQEAFEGAFVLDRRSPFWVTTPVNLGHLQPGSTGVDPASRVVPHLVPYAFPSFGAGPPRFPVDDAADAGVEPATVTAPPGRWPNANQAIIGRESFWLATDRRGHDVRRQGAYEINNTGPTDLGQQPPNTDTGRHDRISFPFSVQGGFMARTAVAFWAEPQTLDGVVLFDHNDGDPDRNRMSVQGRDGNLVLEVLDEAGIDPNPSQSPAGVQRTASEYRLPLAELGLPADTPVHVNVSAPSGRPSDLALHVDGMARGRPAYTTYLTAAIAPFDPTLSNNNPGYGQDPGMTTRNERFLELQVESTEGFPAVGVLRIGLELFEYTSISGNTFQCVFRDSLGGRGARQTGREHRPQIPTDPVTGEPTVDINDPQFEGVNLDVFPEHPAGSLVELYGYSALVSEDQPLMPRQTQLSGSVGGFAVARGFIDNPRPVVITLPNGNSLPVGEGVTAEWTGDLLLADPVPTGRDQPPPNASEQIANGFATGGGYALLIQDRIGFEGNVPGQVTQNAEVGGIEVIRYDARQGNKLVNVQRAQRLAGNDQLIPPDLYDGTARQFVCQYPNGWILPGNEGTWNDLPALILWVVPISLPVNDVSALLDPEALNQTEWLQLYGGGANEDLEWVRYDAIADGRHVVRKNRAAWRSLYTELTRNTARQRVQVNNLGPSQVNSPLEPPWGTVTASSGFIGYTPQVESLYPQVHWARRRLGFRGDPFTGTSSHPQQNATVMQCQRIQLLWGNYGAYTGRMGRHDRVALVNGQTALASGSNRPSVEWHTVTWAARRYGSDRLQQDRQPAEYLGRDPFQLVGFREQVQIPMIGPPDGTIIEDPRQYDRIVKFPSGELPAAFCPTPTVGAGTGNEQPMQGIVDEVEVYQHFAPDLVLDEYVDENAQTLTSQPNFTNNSVGALWSSNDLSAAYPPNGGLLQVDQEIMAYTAVANGAFTIAQNGRGLLNTVPRGHDRGARIKFLTQRPAAILSGSVTGTASFVPLVDIGPLPRAGTLLLGQELLHYCWGSTGDQNGVNMPNWYPPNPDGTLDTDNRNAARGLFRGRFGTAPQAFGSGQVVVLWPTRYWDRYAEFSDDPELAYFQITTNEAPAFFRELRWREETRDPRVQLICSVRTDSLVPWSADPESNVGLWQFTGSSETGEGHRLDRQAARLEVRFQTRYRPGAIDLQAFSSHGWKTTARVENVQVDVEGESRIFDEEVTAR